MSSDRIIPDSVGLVGLGVMGLGIARRLLSSGTKVVGYDIEPSRVERLSALGGLAARSPRDVGEQVGVVLTSLPSAEALRDVVAGIDGLVAATRGGGPLVVETSTLALHDKVWAFGVLEAEGLSMVDSPLSGTEVQLDAGDAVAYVSGDRLAIDWAGPWLVRAVGTVVDVGEFGNGTKIKLIANHLVAIHNVAAAEALLLAQRVGLDPRLALGALVAGAGSSRMLEVRGPLMVDGAYAPAQMSVRLFTKDLDLIAGLAASRDVPTGLFDVTREVYGRALDAGLGESDTASLHSLLHDEAGG